VDGAPGQQPPAAGSELRLPRIAVLRAVRRAGEVVDLRVEALSDGDWSDVVGATSGGAPLEGALVSDLVPAARADGRLAALCAVATTGEAVAMTRPGVAGAPTSGRRIFVQRAGDDRVLVAVRALDASDARREAEQQAGPRWVRAFAEAPLGIAVSSWEGVVLEANPALCALLGRNREQLVGHGFTEFSHPEDADRRVDRDLLARTGRAELRKRYLTGDGRTVWVRAVIAVLHEDGERRVLNIVEDIGEAQRAQRELARMASSDPLTGLPNRVELRRQLRRALRRWAGGEAPAPALLYLDLDHFKIVNDSLGHDAGDRLLRRLADCFVDVIGGAGVVARLGGDEFVVLVHDSRGAEALSQALLDALGTSVRLAGRDVAVGMSIGLAVAEGTSDDEALLRDADTALYAAKRAGRRRWVRLDEALRTRALTRLDDEAALRAGLQAGQLVPHYQPITALDGTWESCEALVRWDHPQRGVLSPAAFLDVAEESGLVVELGQQVLRRALADLARWRRLRPHLTVAVNVAAQHLLSGHLVDDVVAALDAAALPASALTVEVTETALLVSDEVVSAALRSLRAMGCRVALDDFGTGYSSLTHLRDFEVDVMKVDRSFVAAAPTSAEATRLLRAVCLLGRSLELTVVAEGVETPVVRSAAVAAGAHLLQGYLLGRPAPAEEVARALAAGSAGAPSLVD